MAIRRRQPLCWTSGSMARAPSWIGTTHCPVWMFRLVLARYAVWITSAITIVGLTLVGACCPTYSAHEIREKEKAPPNTKSECPESELSEATIRSIGYVAVRERESKLPPTPPSNIRITRYECNYLYTEVFAPDKIGGYVTVVISPDGRVLDVLPGL